MRDNELFRNQKRVREESEVDLLYIDLRPRMLSIGY